MNDLVWRSLLNGGMSLKAQGCQSAGFFDAVLLVDNTHGPENSRKSNSKRQCLCTQPFSLTGKRCPSEPVSSVAFCPYSLWIFLLSSLTTSTSYCCTTHRYPNHPRLKPAKPPLPTHNLHVPSTGQHSASLQTLWSQMNINVYQKC